MPTKTTGARRVGAKKALRKMTAIAGPRFKTSCPAYWNKLAQQRTALPNPRYRVGCPAYWALTHPDET